MSWCQTKHVSYTVTGWARDPKPKMIQGFHTPVETAANATGLYSICPSKAAFLECMGVHKPFSLEVTWPSDNLQFRTYQQKCSGGNMIENKRKQNKGEKKERARRKKSFLHIIHRCSRSNSYRDIQMMHTHNIYREIIYLTQNKRLYFLASVNDTNLSTVFFSF